MFFYKKKKAMSFVELVLVFAIIGFVAALSIPGLKKHSQRSEMAVLAKKAYVSVEDAIDNAILTDGPIRNWSFSSTTTFFNDHIEPNFKKMSVDAANASLVTMDGMLVTVVSCTNSTSCKIEVDVNNVKVPNLSGKDRFRFEVLKNDEKVVPSEDYGTKALWENNWKFTDAMWSKSY